MAWSTTDIATNDIIQQEGVFASNFIASGTRRKGQAVWICADNKVSPCTSDAGDADGIGFACYDQTTAGNQIAIAGPGNIVVCCMDANTSAPGTLLYGDADGILDATAGNASRAMAILVDNSPEDVSGSAACTNHVIKALVI